MSQFDGFIVYYEKGDECFYDPTKEFSADINFICDPNAGDGFPSVLSS